MQKSKYHREHKVKYNLRFDKHSPKDHLYLPKPQKLPTKVDLSKKLPAAQVPYDQGDVGSCTANSAAFIYTFDELKQKNNDQFMPSRLFIYYNTRVLFGDVNSDDGASIKDAIRSVVQSGVCEEKLWPYSDDNVLVKPPQKCYDEAKKCKAQLYCRVAQTLTGLKTTLNNGYPISFGFTVYSSFESDQVAQTGIMPMPAENEEVMGGHAVAMVGYDDEKKMFKVRNSWGTGWGDNGYFWMPYAFAINKNYCDDFWMISKISDPDIIKGQNAVELNPVQAS